jgi:hypothetical protein
MSDDLPSGAIPTSWDGFTLDDLSDYLDDDRTPRNPAIEDSAACREVLARLAVLRTATIDLLEADADAARVTDERWIEGVLATIRTTARAGRDIPVPDPDPASTLVITEGAIRGLVRRVGDGLPGMVVRRTRLLGDVGTVGAPIDVDVAVSVAVRVPITPLADELRATLMTVLAVHTPLVVASLVVRVVDLHEDGGAA